MKHVFNLNSLEDIGSALSYYRMLKGVSLAEVSFATGLAVSVIHKLERGKIKSVNSATLFKLTEYFGLTLKVVA